MHRDDDRPPCVSRPPQGFRALARDLGRRLGCGAHLEGLRRTRSGWFDLSRAMPLGEAERLGPDVAGSLISPADALPDLPAVEVNEVGLKRVTHGNWLGPEHLVPVGPLLTDSAGARGVGPALAMPLAGARANGGGPYRAGQKRTPQDDVKSHFPDGA
jgi:hypothetical protein